MLNTQPTLASVMSRLAEELAARAALLLHANGQILERSGHLDEAELPPMAALVSAMIAAGQSLVALGEREEAPPTRFGWESSAAGMYCVAIDHDRWLAVLYDQPLNPGQLRMKVRRYAETLARIGARPADFAEGLPKNVTKTAAAGASSALVRSAAPPPPENFTQRSNSLFANITDGEIDQLFESASS